MGAAAEAGTIEEQQCNQGAVAEADAIDIMVLQVRVRQTSAQSCQVLDCLCR